MRLRTTSASVIPVCANLVGDNEPDCHGGIDYHVALVQLSPHPVFGVPLILDSEDQYQGG
jgi:hypothetical protein